MLAPENGQLWAAKQRCNAADARPGSEVVPLRDLKFQGFETERRPNLNIGTII